MKSMRVKKAVVTAIVAVMMAGSIGVMPQGGSAVQAAEPEIKDVNLGTRGISNPDSDTTEGWQGSKVYYAGKLCYVLDKDGQLGGNSSVGGSMLLLTEKIINSQAFNTWGTSDWSTSSVRENLKSTSLAEAEGGFLRSFSAVEQSCIADTSISRDNTKGDYGISYPSASTKDKIFLLDLADVENFAYGFDSNSARDADSWWWLRSPGSDTYDAADVYDGNVGSGGFDVTYGAGSVRPAFNLNLDSVLFTSVSEANKSVFDLVGKDKVDNTWKLTLKDGDGDFEAKLLETAEAGREVTVNVTTEGTGSYNQTSAILADGQGTVVAYGRIGDPGTGDKIFKIPEGITQGNYRLHVFEEQANTGKLTNYASNVATKEIKIGPSVTITPGSFMTKTRESGAEKQSGLIAEPMKDVVYTADVGYYFPDNYVSTITGLIDGKLNGIKVTRDGFTQITVSGTPAISTAITLAGATEKGTPAAPTGLSDGVDKIAGTKTTMQYAARADAPANEWKDCTDGNTTVAAGTWYVRYKETETQKAGAAAEVTVSQAPSRYDVTITWGDHMTKTSDSGEVKQTGLTGAMKAVVYTAEAGFYFPTDYSVAPVNGISVKRDDYTQITVAGTPTANATIHLIKPTEKDQQDAPTGLGDGVEKIAGTKTTMEYAVSADATADAWKTCTDGNTTVKAGTWYVRYKETETKKVGATAAVTVTAPKTPTPKPTYTITDGAGTAYTIGSGKTLTITCSGALSDLTGIYVDEKQVDAKNYTVKLGSTILTLKTSYLDSLSVGAHNLKFAYGEESAKTTFEIKAAAAKASTPAAETPAKKEVSPKTGDQTSTLWLLLLVLASGVGACYRGKRTVRK